MRPNTSLPLLRRDKSRFSRQVDQSARPYTTTGLINKKDTDKGRISLPLDLSEVPLRLKEKLESFRSYKKLPRVVERNEYEKVPNQPHVNYFLTLEKEKTSPRAWGVLHRSYTGGDILAQHYFLGQKCAHALAHGLDTIDDVERVYLQGNRLTSHSTLKILKRLHSKHTREIDLSDNHVNPNCITELSAIISAIPTHVKILRLEACGLGIKEVEMLCQTLVSNASLRELSLAKNQIGQNAGVYIGEMVQYNGVIRRLDLHWNKLKPPGVLRLIEGLKLNDGLQEVDLSWNSLAQGDNKETALAISNWMRHDDHLRHLDLSFNYLTAEMWSDINLGLNENHTLVGLHVSGNYCQIDARGFVTPSEHCEKSSSALISPRILKSKPGVGTCCWLCGRWVEVTITLEDPALAPPLFVHFDFEGYEPELMHTQGHIQTLTRAVPPGRRRYFISTLNEVIQPEELQLEPGKVATVVKYYEGKTREVELKALHAMTVFEPCYKAKQVLATLPRTQRNAYRPPEEVKEKEPWSLPISLFKTYRFTTDKISNECFESDWASTRISRIVKDPDSLSTIKSMLQSSYKVL